MSHVFGADGTLKRRMLEYKYNYWNPICGKVGKPTFKFAMHNDQIYYFDEKFYLMAPNTLQLLKHLKLKRINKNFFLIAAEGKILFFSRNL